MARDGRIIPVKDRSRDTQSAASAKTSCATSSGNDNKIDNPTSMTTAIASRRNDNPTSMTTEMTSERNYNPISMSRIGSVDRNYDIHTDSKERRMNNGDGSLKNPVIRRCVSGEVSDIAASKSDFALFRMGRRAARSSRSSSPSETKHSVASRTKLAGYKIPRKCSSSPCLSEGKSEHSSSTCSSESKSTAGTSCISTSSEECRVTNEELSGAKIPRRASLSSTASNLGGKNSSASVGKSCKSDRPSTSYDREASFTSDGKSITSICQPAADVKLESVREGGLPDFQGKSCLVKGEISKKKSFHSAKEGNISKNILPVKALTHSQCSSSSCKRTIPSSFPDGKPSTSTDTWDRVDCAPPIQQCRNNMEIIQMLREKRENMIAKVLEGSEMISAAKRPSLTNFQTDKSRSHSKPGSSLVPVAVVKPSSHRSSWRADSAQPSTSSGAPRGGSLKSNASKPSASNSQTVSHSDEMLSELNSDFERRTSVSPCRGTQKVEKETPSGEASKESERETQRRLVSTRFKELIYYTNKERPHGFAQ